MGLVVLGAVAAGAGLLWLRSAPPPAPPPTKSELPLPSDDQSAGSWHKVVLVSDEQVNGEWTDTLRYPIALDVADDGRVFFAEWSGP